MNVKPGLNHIVSARRGRESVVNPWVKPRAPRSRRPNLPACILLSIIYVRLSE